MLLRGGSRVDRFRKKGEHKALTAAERHGLWLYETPGHSAGHVALLVHSDRGARPMLFPFDVALSRAAFEREIQASFHSDPVAGQRSIRRVKELAAEHGAEMYYAHDAEAWSGWKHAPDYYEV